MADHPGRRLAAATDWVSLSDQYAERIECRIQPDHASPVGPGPKVPSAALACEVAHYEARVKSASRKDRATGVSGVAKVGPVDNVRSVRRDLQHVVDAPPWRRQGGRRIAQPQQGLRVPVDPQLVA